MKIFAKIPQWLLVLFVVTLWAFYLALTHSGQSIVSFDEGFHGGAVVFTRELVNFFLHAKQYPNPHYLLAEFNNGIVLYPPLWTGVAYICASLFGYNLEVLRFATSLFYIVALMSVYFFVRTVCRSNLAAWAATVIVGTMPMIMIYSNLMMLEVPQLAAISGMVMLF